MPQSLSVISYINYPKYLLRKKKKILKKTNWISLGSFVLSLLIIGCFVFYLYMEMCLVEMNFDLRKKEEEVGALENETKQLESKIGNTLSIEELKKKVQDLKLTKANEIRYLRLKGTPTLSLENK